LKVWKMSMLVKPWKLVGFAVGGTVGAATVRDYRRWRSLGEGGVPANAIGYVIVSLLRLVKREPLSTKPYDAMKSDPYNQSWISALPTRHGTRPSIDPHPIPQRQVDQHGANDVMAQTQELFDRTVAAHSRLKYARSGFETRHDAITLVAPAEGHTIAQRTRGEIAHIHPIDGSMHMIFSPRDAAQVLEGADVLADRRGEVLRLDEVEVLPPRVAEYVAEGVHAATALVREVEIRGGIIHLRLLPRGGLEPPDGRDDRGGPQPQHPFGEDGVTPRVAESA